MLRISRQVCIPGSEIKISAIRAQGAGGQNVNKVSSAIHLRFDSKVSSLPGLYKQRLLKLNDHRITKDGIIVIKVQEFRSQERNRNIALLRLKELIKDAVAVRKKRKPTRPTKRSQQMRVDKKTRHGRIKSFRKKNFYDE